MPGLIEDGRRKEGIETSDGVEKKATISALEVRECAFQSEISVIWDTDGICPPHAFFGHRRWERASPAGVCIRQDQR